jgi:anti-anti-sigma factor
MWARSEHFWVRAEKSERVTVLRLTGRFDSAAHRRLDRAIGEARGRDVVMDLGGLTFMDGGAWLSVMEYEQRVRRWGGRFRLVNAFGGALRISDADDDAEDLLDEAAN